MKIMRPGKKKRGASILLLSFFFMVVLFLLAATLYKIVPAEMHAANRSYQDTQGHYVARAGLEESMRWLGTQMDVFTKTQVENDFPDYNSGSDLTPGGRNLERINEFLALIDGKSVTGDPKWTVNIEIEPLQDSRGMKNALEPRFYSVRSTSLFNKKPVRTIDVLLRQRTFASLVYLTNHMTEGTGFIIGDKPTFFGPVHTNEFFRFAPENGLWGATIDRKNAFFQGTVTHAESTAASPDGNLWLSDLSSTTYAAANAPLTNGSGTGYEQVFSDGRNGLRKKNEIELPRNSDEVRNDAWKQTVIPTDPGVYISADPSTGKVDGGIYVQGSVDEMKLLLDKSGNQRIEFDKRASGSTRVWDPNRRVRGPYTGRTWNPNAGACIDGYYPSGNSGGGLNGGSLAYVCTKRAGAWQNHYGPSVVEPGWVYQSADVDHKVEIYEVTEKPVPYTDENGESQVAVVGQTLYIKTQRQQTAGTWSEWSVEETAQYDGTINGSIFVEGDIGKENAGVDNDQRGLWGITKGSPIKSNGGTAPVDADGFEVDIDGNREYRNKTIATPLDNSINLGGDLLQFSYAAFVSAGDIDFSQMESNNKDHKHARAALNPDAVDPVTGESKPELSPNNDHVLGLFTRDVWMKGRKSSGSRNGSNGINDVYAVMLAGKTISDPGEATKAIGGFGTWYHDRDRLSDKLGKFRIFGGVIQGTTGANGSNEQYSHVFKTGGVGYDVELHYDIEATRQRLFPTIPEFRVVRYLEKSARERG